MKVQNVFFFLFKMECEMYVIFRMMSNEWRYMASIQNLSAFLKLFQIFSTLRVLRLQWLKKKTTFPLGDSKYCDDILESRLIFTQVRYDCTAASITRMYCSCIIKPLRYSFIIPDDLVTLMFFRCAARTERQWLAFNIAFPRWSHLANQPLSRHCSDTVAPLRRAWEEVPDKMVGECQNNPRERLVFDLIMPSEHVHQTHTEEDSLFSGRGSLRHC